MNYNSNVTSIGQLKLTQSEIAYLQQYLDSNDRGGYYLALYNMTGVTQVLVQGEISTFSEAGGGAAYVSNMLMYACIDKYKIELTEYIKKNPRFKGDPTLDTFSNIIAQTDLDIMDNYRKGLDKTGKKPLGKESTGYLDDETMLEMATQGWINVKIPELFPGNLLTAAYEGWTGANAYIADSLNIINSQLPANNKLPSKLEALKSLVQIYIDNFQDENFDAKIFLKSLLTTGDVC